MPISSMPPRVFAIASGKGGVGKTWFSITLAHALARDGRRVMLVDGDLGLANVDIQLGLSPAQDLGSVLAGRATLAAAAAHFAPGGFDILAGRSGSGALASLPLPLIDQIMAGLSALPYDAVLIDLGAGLETPVRHMAARADRLLVLATDEPTSLTDAYAVLKLHMQDAPGAEAGLVINQAANPAAGQRTYTALARACTQFLGRAPELCGVVRKDACVRDAIRRQTPLLTRHPGSQAGADVCQIAGGLLRARLAQAG